MYIRMKSRFCFVVACLFSLPVFGQSVSAKLAAAFSAFEKDSQLKSGLASICVTAGETGNIVFEKASHIGLAPASTQKIITAATAYELLGKDFRYQTRFGYLSGNGEKETSSGVLWVAASGDPTLGSWRWKTTSEKAVIERLLAAMKREGITAFDTIVVNNTDWANETIPGGWIWDDIGNYYGAFAGVFNWRENQYDLFLKSGKNIGDSVIVTGTAPDLYRHAFVSYAKSAAKGSGDNAYIYFPLTGGPLVVRGTIPVGEDHFAISGAIPDAAEQLSATLQGSLSINGTQTKDINGPDKSLKQDFADTGHYFHTETSPPLDSIVYWFLKLSINLYGEALAKTMAVQKGKPASTANAAAAIRDFWEAKNIGIVKTELNMIDGSGLSPQNRVTTHAQTAVLRYAQKQPWFAGYYNAFPEFNGMKLKSGTIGGAKSFCGYHTSKEGKKYIVSFIVNNYNGAPSALVQKMYKVLDVLK